MTAASVGLLLSGVGLCLTGYSLLRAQRLERAKWAAQLALQFFGETYREMREELDNDPSQIENLVREQSAKFTEFLNFLELVAYLRNRRQINKSDMNAVFGYYLRKVGEHPSLVRYISDPLYSYEELAKILSGA